MNSYTEQPKICEKNNSDYMEHGHRSLETLDGLSMSNSDLDLNGRMVIFS